MIDVTKAKKEFKKYVEKYDIDNQKIKLKIAHVERTSIIAKKMAESLKLSQEDIELAELIGLLHDIGRFEQIRKYGTFVDHLSENHAKIGVDILFKDGLIRNFIEDSKYDKIIELAIINHNRDRKDITKNISDKEDLHIKLIRDSDKTDILYILTFEKKKAIWESDNLEEEKFTDEICREFIENHSIIYKNKKTHVDSLICQFAYVFDFNFDYGLKYVYENRYYQNLYERFKFKDKKNQDMFKKIYDITNNFIVERLNESNDRYKKM